MCFYVTNFFGQDPNWNFNLNDYQFNMTFTTALNINGAALSSPNDKVEHSEKRLILKFTIVQMIKLLRFQVMRSFN